MYHNEVILPKSIRETSTHSSLFTDEELIENVGTETCTSPGVYALTNIWLNGFLRQFLTRLFMTMDFRTSVGFSTRNIELFEINMRLCRNFSRKGNSPSTSYDIAIRVKVTSTPSVVIYLFSAETSSSCNRAINPIRRNPGYLNRGLRFRLYAMRLRVINIGETEVVIHI